MTFISFKAIIACAVFTTTAVASTANASSVFNKFPATQSETNIKVENIAKSSVITQKRADFPIKNRHVKRTVEPLPMVRSSRLSYASDNGTQNLKDGFNKMAPDENGVARPMPTFVQPGAGKSR